MDMYYIIKLTFLIFFGMFNTNVVAIAYISKDFEAIQRNKHWNNVKQAKKRDVQRGYSLFKYSLTYTRFPDTRRETR